MSMKYFRPRREGGSKPESHRILGPWQVWGHPMKIVFSVRPSNLLASSVPAPPHPLIVALYVTMSFNAALMSVTSSALHVYGSADTRGSLLDLSAVTNVSNTELGITAAARSSNLCRYELGANPISASSVRN